MDTMLHICFRPLSGISIIYRYQRKSSAVILYVFVPSRGYLLSIADIDVLTCNEEVSFRPLSGISIIYQKVVLFKMYVVYRFRPLSGISIIYPIMSYVAYEQSVVFVPSRGYLLSIPVLTIPLIIRAHFPVCGSLPQTRKYFLLKTLKYSTKPYF